MSSSTKEALKQREAADHLNRIAATSRALFHAVHATPPAVLPDALARFSQQYQKCAAGEPMPGVGGTPGDQADLCSAVILLLNAAIRSAPPLPLPAERTTL